MIVDLVISVLILGMAYALMSEGLWGAALMFFNVLFAGIVAFNFYEPLAALLATNVSFLSGFADTLCLLAIFIVALVMLRLTTETIAPSLVRFPPPVYHIGRVFFAVAGSALTMAILIIAFETAPVHKKVFGSIDYKNRPPFNMGLDHEWLGFFQYTTGDIFANYNAGNRDPFSQYGTAKVFDPRAEWLIHHQEARPYGTDSVLGEETNAAAAAAPGAPAATSSSGGGGSRPGDPVIVGPAVGGGVVLPQ